MNPAHRARDGLLQGVPVDFRRIPMKSNGFLAVTLGAAFLAGACNSGVEAWDPDVPEEEDLALMDEDLASEEYALQATDPGELAVAWDEDELSMTGDELVEEGDYGTLECGMNEFVGGGSCVKNCYRSGSCGNGQPKWICQAFNYEHWRSCYWWGCNNAYWRSSGAFDGYNFCANSDPSNCPGFCN
jgi:hypothetical protein